MPLGNRLTTPQTDWGQTSGNEDFIREAARKEQVRQMQEFDRESKKMGLEEDPTASAYAEAYHNMKYGFDPPPDVPTYYGSPALDLGPGFRTLPPLQPGAVDPEFGSRQTPLNPSYIDPVLSDRGWMDEGKERWRRDEEERGTYTPGEIFDPNQGIGLPPQPPNLGFPVLPRPPRVERLPPTKVYSAPIGRMFEPRWRPPQPPG